MTKLKCFLISFTALTIQVNYSFGQGCSDAGFCTINSFKPESGDGTGAFKNQFKIGAFFGGADNAVSVYGNYAEYNRQLNENIGVDIKWTTLAQNGNGLSVFGLADVFLNANYRASDKLRLTLGTKIPLTKSNKSLDNLPLPMDYQASLGTFDLIFGLGYEISKLQIVAAIQQPLTQNDNRFFASSYPVGSKLVAFQSTYQFKRSGDVLLRVSYPISLSEKMKLTPGLLPIYHIANDKYTDELNNEKEIVGSQGLTLNGNIYLDYEINKRSTIQVNVGVPFVVRESRPDGLTRSFIANAEYRILF